MPAMIREKGRPSRARASMIARAAIMPESQK